MVKYAQNIPNPDSDILSQIQVIVIAPHTRNEVVTITCFTLHNGGQRKPSLAGRISLLVQMKKSSIVRNIQDFLIHNKFYYLSIWKMRNPEVYSHIKNIGRGKVHLSFKAWNDDQYSTQKIKKQIFICQEPYQSAP